MLFSVLAVFHFCIDLSTTRITITTTTTATTTTIIQSMIVITIITTPTTRSSHCYHHHHHQQQPTTIIIIILTKNNFNRKIVVIKLINIAHHHTINHTLQTVGHFLLGSPTFAIPGLAYTPVLQTSNIYQYFSVQVTGVTMNGTSISGLADLNAPANPIVDSGTTLLYANNEMNQYALLFAALQMVNLDMYAYFQVNPFTFTGTPQQFFCGQGATVAYEFAQFFNYDAQVHKSGYILPNASPIVVSFAGGASVSIQPASLWLYESGLGTVRNIGLGLCGAFCGNALSSCLQTILGNPVFFGNAIVFDMASNRVGFAPVDTNQCQQPSLPSQPVNPTCVVNSSLVPACPPIGGPSSSTQEWPASKIAVVAVVGTLAGVLVIASLVVLCNRKPARQTNSGSSRHIRNVAGAGVVMPRTAAANSGGAGAGGGRGGGASGGNFATPYVVMQNDEDL